MAPTELYRNYTPEQVETALTAIATTGSMKEAAELTGIPYTTVTTWRYKYADKYERIKEKRAPEIEQAVIRNLREIMARSGNAVLLSIDKAVEQLEAGDVKDAAAYARNLATTQAIAADKMLLLDGRPTSISEHRTVDDELRELERLGFFDTTCEEEPPDSAQTPDSALRSAVQETNAPELSRPSHS